VKGVRLLAALAAVSLAGAGVAAASPAAGDKGELLVKSHRDANGLVATTVSLMLPQGPVPTRMTITAPAGYALQLNRPAGSTVGDASAIFVGPTVVAAIGSLRIGDPAAYADATSAACDPGPHLGVLVTDLIAPGTSTTSVLPIFVDASGAATTFRLCSSSLPAAVAASSLQRFDLTFNGAILTAPKAPGSYTWSALIESPDPGAAYELRSVLPVPQSLTLSARYDAKTHRALLSGRLLVMGKPEAGVSVTFDASSRHVEGASFGPVKTDAQGRFSTTWLVNESTDFTAHVASESGSCNGPSTAPAGCAGETTDGPDDALASLHVPLATDAKVALKRADVTLARSIDLKPADFPPGWQAQAAPPGSDEPLCDAFHPNESDLTVTGRNTSQSFATGSPSDMSSFRFAGSATRVFATATQAASAFRREAVRGLVSCLAGDVKAQGGGQVTLQAAGTVPFPKLDRGAKAFRLVVAFGSDDVYADYVYVEGARSTSLLAFFGLGKPFDPALERTLAAKLAKRAAASR
jgi:hypothetical protein